MIGVSFVDHNEPLLEQRGWKRAGNQVTKTGARYKVLRASGLVNTLMCLEGGVPGKGIDALCPPHHALSYASLPFGCS